MKKRLGLFLLVGALVAVGLAFGANRPRSALAYPGADSVNISEVCLQNNRVEIQVTWQSYNVGIQFVDLSLYDNGFVPGTFIGNGPIAPYQNSMVWDGLLPGYWHFLRVNTLTPYGWYASQTVQFYSRNDCYSQPPVCYPGQYNCNNCYPGQVNCNNCYPGQYNCNNCNPGQYNYQNQYCPPPPPPPPPVGNNNCPLVTTLIYPSTVGGRVCTNKADYATYFRGESITYCYSVSQPMQVNIVVSKPDGTQVSVVNGYDDGTGGCVTGLVGSPAGLRTITMYGNNNQVLSQTHFYGQ